MSDYLSSDQVTDAAIVSSIVDESGISTNQIDRSSGYWAGDEAGYTPSETANSNPMEGTVPGSADAREVHQVRFVTSIYCTHDWNISS
jgi:hypothetical protein